MKSARSTFKILFYLKRNAQKKDGSVPVMCRITVDGTISQFSCKFDIDPLLWDTKGGRVTGKSAVAKEPINVSTRFEWVLTNIISRLRTEIVMSQPKRLEMPISG